jgi:hypothetical protein
MLVPGGESVIRKLSLNLGIFRAASPPSAVLE